MAGTITVEAQMMIRKPVEEVYNAFIDPAITKHFWFTKSSGKLETGQTVEWEWEMYQVTTNVYVKQLVPNELISIEWDEPPTTVDFVFQKLAEDKTYVQVRNYGFAKPAGEILELVKDLTGGFTTVLDGLKAYLEHGINLNLVADKFPKEAMREG
ncbi:SRPBCC family protein [Aridibaculum aurantiacum]|uniref:SRPBCC family protein n=1 Tax=Aridibaculum aurantiacum TaxID=2810307 RepID=UPI001A96AEFA|nr:SRPBCC family protein [Aridibaculum aurantiacum]